MTSDHQRVQRTAMNQRLLSIMFALSVMTISDHGVTAFTIIHRVSPLSTQLKVPPSCNRRRKQQQQQQQQQQMGAPNNRYDTLPCTRRRTSTRIYQQEPSDDNMMKEASISDILDELNKRGIAFSPTASKAELESLLKDPPKPKPSTGTTATTNDLLNELDVLEAQILSSSKTNPSESEKPIENAKNQEIRRNQRRRQRQPREGISREWRQKEQYTVMIDDDVVDDVYEPMQRRRRDETSPRRNRPMARDSRPRERRGQRERRNRYGENDGRGLDDGNYEPLSDREYRRQRRRQRASAAAGSAGDVLRIVTQKASSLVPDEVSSLGNQAARVAKQKTTQLWNELQEELELDKEYEGEMKNTRSRRPRERQSQQSRRRTSASSSSYDRSVDNRNRPVSNYYDSDSDAEAKNSQNEQYAYGFDDDYYGKDDDETKQQLQTRMQKPKSRRRPVPKSERFEPMGTGPTFRNPTYPEEPRRKEDRKKVQPTESTIQETQPIESMPASFSKDETPSVESPRAQKEPFSKDEAPYMEPPPVQKEIPKIPIREILQVLDEKDIAFSPDASRQELEKLYFEAKEKVDGDDDDEVPYYMIDESDDKDGRKEKLESLWSKTKQVATNRARKVSKVGQRATEKAYKKTQKKLQEKIQDAQKFLTEDDDEEEKSQNSNGTKIDSKDIEEIIVDAIIEEHHPEDSLDDPRKKSPFNVIEVEPLEDYGNNRNTNRRSNSNTNRPREEARRRRSRPAPRNDFYDDDIDYPRRQRRTRPTVVNQRRRSDYSESTSEAYQLPPAAFDDGEINGEVRGKKRYGRRESFDKKRRIYSPYASDYNSNGDDDYAYNDEFEQVGNFMANTVETFLWGPEGDERRVGGESRRRRSSRSRRNNRSGHWKDRMEQQFDAMMGINSDGKHYRRWSENDARMENEATGTDATSYARGTASKRGLREKLQGRRQRKQPIWEQDESLISLLFGTGSTTRKENARLRRSDPYSSPYGGLIPGSRGSLVRLCRNLFQSFTVVGGAVGRWASVRGSLPQPVVVVGAVSACLSARPGYRFRNVVLALLGLRVVGELLHGYIYEDSEFFDEENEYLEGYADEYFDLDGGSESPKNKQEDHEIGNVKDPKADK